MTEHLLRYDITMPTTHHPDFTPRTSFAMQKIAERKYTHWPDLEK